MTLTSPTYLIEVASTSTSGDGGTDVGPHTHTWSEHYEVKRHTTTENIIGYKCNNAKCGYSTENETLYLYAIAVTIAVWNGLILPIQGYSCPTALLTIVTHSLMKPLGNAISAVRELTILTKQ